MRVAPWLAYLVAGCVAVAIHAQIADPRIAGPLYVAVAVSAVVAILTGARTHAPILRPWWLLAAGNLVFVVADILHDALPGDGAMLPGVDLLYFTGYPLVALGLLLLLRARRQHDPEGAIDAAVVALAAALVGWVLLKPAFASADAPALDRLFVVAYPVADVVLLGLAVMLVAAGGWRLLAGRAVAVAVAALFLADIAYGSVRLVAVDGAGWYAETLWLISYVAFGTAALHPSMARLGEPGSDAAAILTRWQVAALAAAGMVGPALLVFANEPGLTIDDLIVGGGAVALWLLVLARLGGLGIRLDTALTQYRSLVEGMPAVVYRESADTLQVTYISPQITDLLGYTPNEALSVFNDPDRGLIHPDDLPGYLAEADRSGMGGVFRHEYRMRAKHGAWVWVRDDTVLVRDVAGRPLWWQGNLTDVSALRQAEAALRASEARFAAFMDHSPLPAWMKDGNFRFAWFNDTFLRVFGLGPAEAVLGRSDAEIWPAFEETYNRNDLAALRDGRVEAVEQAPAADGEIRSWLSVKFAFATPDGDRYVGGIGVDLTERLALEARLSASEERFRAAFEDAAIGMGIVGLDGRWQAVNAALCDLIGYPAEAFVGDAIGRLTLPEDLPRGHDLWRRLLSGTARSGQVVQRVRHRDGRIVRVRATLAIVRDGEGRPVHLIAQVEDVTARHEAEAQLAAAEARYRALVEQLPVVVYAQSSADPNAAAYVSPYTERMYGIPPDEWAQGFVERLHPEDRERVLAEVARTDETQEPFLMEYRERAADGRWLWVRDEAVLVRDEHGRPDYWLGVKFDATEQRRLEADLRAAKDAAEEANRLKSEFLSTMSHELRTPMNAIIGYAHLLLDGMGGDLTEAQAADVRQIAEGADRLLALIDDILDLSRIEAGRFDLAREPVDVAALVEQVRAELAPLAAARGLALTATADAGLPLVTADPKRLRQILLNLAGNAVKFTERGEVRIAARLADGAIEVAVSDTGIGIAPEVLPHVFDEFRQADGSTSRRYGGSGLGLAIARRLAQLHGGDIRAESAPGAGSTFTLRLPLGGADPAEPEPDLALAVSERPFH